MGQFMALTGRNLKLYFRDKGAVFFSLLSMLIVIGLMLFFLGDMNIEGLTDLLGQFTGRTIAQDKKNAELLIFSWTCAGIISINAVTVTMAVYTIMIKDRVSGKLNSIYTAPISRTVIAAGYIAAAWLASILVCVITLFLTELYGVIKGLDAFSFSEHLELIGMIMANSFVYTALMYLVTMIAKTEGAWSGLGTVVGTLVGFLGGIYIPIGALADVVGNIMKCTPVIYGTAMFRSVMMKGMLDKTFSGVPDEVISEYRESMGIDLEIFGRGIDAGEELCLLLLCGILFLAIGVIALKYSRKTDR